MKKNLKVALTLLVAMSTVLAACGKNNNASSPEASPNESSSATGSESPGESSNIEPFTVSLRHIQIGEPQKFRKAILDDVVKKTEGEIPGLKFELDGIEDAVNRFTKLPAEMAAGNPPKIFDMFGGNADALKYAKAGRLLDLTPILDELGIKDKFLNVFSQFTLDGKIYGLPIGGNMEGVFYNTEIFSANGLNAPTTWDDLIKAADSLKAKGITPFATGSQAGWVPNMLVNTLIGRNVAANYPNGLTDGTLKWNSPEFVAAYATYGDWVKKGYFTKGELGKTYDDMLNEFAAGKAAMIFDGSWRSSAFKAGAVAANLEGKVGFIALPAIPDYKGDQTSINANYGNGYGFSSDLNDNELKAVTAFIKNLYNDEMQLRGLLEDGVLPSMKLSDEALANVTDPLVKQVMETMSKASSSFVHFDSVVQKAVNSETELQLQKLIANKATAQQVGDAIQKVQDSENAKK
ncbi:extracellular solute-binding protein [Cohnella endophytica]|uniref:Extracellular solute-binding protein n=1 Tax=Cohnella endophytica TaxID=2419778 RepID=A0A494Y184_9BACL|nr:extracellular solute-binding protein [Cohnella endophytica]RKP55123.1 extracellular solute-binding protein [Cohnella endophytica]